MPIYEFVCQECGYEFERIQSFSDNSLPRCGQCDSEHVQRRLSPPAIHFKGSGWYITDSKNDNKRADKSTARANGSGTSSENGTGSDKAKQESSAKVTERSDS
ncbi:hypothetical protein RY27_11975 [Litorilinea aerophila]|nr:hypothetical protein RY27_11975 [Litorilinea aerophila]